MVYNSSYNSNRSSGRRNFGRRDFGGPAGPRQMHKAVCSSCGRDCEVPFRPSGEKPVFCSDCFEKNRGGSDTGRFEERSFRKPNFEPRNERPPQNNEQFNTLNAKLDKILAILTSIEPQEVEEDKTPVNIVEKKKKAPKSVVLTPEA